MKNAKPTNHKRFSKRFRITTNGIEFRVERRILFFFWNDKYVEVDSLSCARKQLARIIEKEGGWNAIKEEAVQESKTCNVSPKDIDYVVQQGIGHHAAIEEELRELSKMVSRNYILLLDLVKPAPKKRSSKKITKK